jgi:1,4-dihydroxy-2-naphthoyl-CoA hydrolase
MPLRARTPPHPAACRHLRQPPLGCLAEVAQVRDEQDSGGQAAPAAPAAPAGSARSAVMAAEQAERIKRAFGEDAAQTLVGRMGIKIIEASAERVVATMPVAGNTQPYGLLHGGASCVLAETVGSLGSALHAGPDRLTVGIEISASHHRGASAGLVTAVATMLHGGRTMSTYEIVITDEQGRRVCTARLSCLHRDAIPGHGPALGPVAGLSDGSGSGPAHAPAGESRPPAGDV